MTQLTRLAQMVEELRQQLEQVQDEVRALQAGEEPEAATRSLPTTAIPRPNLPNVVLPTPTDDPDSIVGGRRTLLADFQDCCAVGNEVGFFCSGTLIAPTVVVTAKHCENPTRVFLNGNDINWPERGEIISVKPKHCYSHPDVNVDLQVLVLERPSVALPRRVAGTNETKDFEEVMLVGFGTINLSGNVGYGVKRQVKVPLAYIDTQSDDDYRSYGCSGDFEMVAGHRGLGRDSCKGDSGGPLYIQDENGAYALLAATSRGAKHADNTCGDGGIYVRIDRFLDWIREVAGEEI